MIVIQSATAQLGTISIEVDDQDNLKSVVDKLCSRNKYLIAYAPELLTIRPQNKGIITAENLKDLLTKLFPTYLEVEQIGPDKILLRGENSHQLRKESHFLQGLIKDQDGQVLSDILVYDKSGNCTYSDSNGHFALYCAKTNLDQSITFQAIGYQKVVKFISEIAKDPQIRLEINPIIFDPITVQEKLPVLKINNGTLGITVSATAFQTARSLLQGNDIVKQIQYLPGVEGGDDLNSQIKIRGSDGNESLIILDGIPLYKIDHFYGVFGSINGDYVREATLYKNALPAEYGGKTGGMLSMTSNRPNKSVRGKIDIDLLTSSLYLATPLSKTFSMQIAGRSTYRNSANLASYDQVLRSGQKYFTESTPLNPTTLLQTQPTFNFYDINAGFVYRPNDHWKMDLNFFKGNDALENNFDLSYTSRINRVEVVNEQIFRNDETWDHSGVSFNLSHELNRGLTLTANNYYTSYQNEALLQSSFSILRPAETLSLGISNLQNTHISTYGSKVFLSKDDLSNQFKAGIDLKSHQASYSFSEDDNVLLSGDGVATEMSLFAEKTWKNSRTNISIGGRSTYYSLTKDWYIDPKLQASFVVDKQNTFKASIHHAHQYIRELNYETRFGQSTDYLLLGDGDKYPVGSSLQYMLGYTYKKEKLTIDLELYQKHLDGTLEFALQTLGFNDGFNQIKNRSYRIFTGQGKVIGVDLLIRKEWKNAASQLAYTLSKSTRNFAQILRNQPFAAQDDRRHQFKWINSYTIGAFTLAANYIYSSGKPYFALAEIPALSNRKDIPGSQLIKTLPSYQRLDLGLDFEFNFFSRKATVGLGCFNVTNRDNVKYLQYIFSVPTDSNQGKLRNNIFGAETSLLSRTPNFRFRIEF